MLELVVMKLTIIDALKRAAYFLDRKDLKKAKKIYEIILLSQPNNLDANNNIGLIFYKLGNFEEAIIFFKKAISIDPNFYEAHSNLGAVYKIQKKYDEAKEIYNKIIIINPNYAQAYNNLGVIFEEQNKFDQSKSYYKKAIEINPKSIEFNYNLGNIYSKLNKFDDAILFYNKTINLEPNHKSALLNRGQIFFKKGLFEFSLKDFDKCNTKKSRPRSLASLFALNRIDEICKRIKDYSKLDSNNLGIAAFSSFINFKLNRDIEFNFCKNPLNFIRFSNLSTYLDNYAQFNIDLINKLKKIQSTWEPQNKTTINGFQSKPNLFENPKNELNILREIIIKELDLYRFKFLNEECDYIKKWPKRNSFSCWCVILKKKGHQNSHIHPSGWLSGVIYLKTVPSLKKNEGAIEFSLNGEHYFDPKSPKKIYQPKIGDIVLFPSSLHHRTIPFSSDADRISIAFDLIPNF